MFWPKSVIDKGGEGGLEYSHKRKRGEEKSFLKSEEQQPAIYMMPEESSLP